MNNGVDSKIQLLLRRFRPKSNILLAQNWTLSKRSLARFNMTRVVLKTFTFSAGSKFLSIDNVVLGPILKHLLFTMVKNTFLIGSLSSNPHKFQHYDTSDFSFSER